MGRRRQTVTRYAIGLVVAAALVVAALLARSTVLRRGGRVQVATTQARPSRPTRGAFLSPEGIAVNTRD